MNWTIKNSSTLHCHILCPEFIADTKKEQKAAQRMNSFYGDIIIEAVKKSEQNGLKYYIDISPDNCDGVITVTFHLRIRERGRTLKSIRAESCWENGVIIKKSTY